MKKQKIYAIVAVILAFFATFIIVYERGGFKKSYYSKSISHAFAIKDTSTITKVFMADMHGSKVLLTKEPQGWVVDNHKAASAPKVNDMLVTLTAIRIAQPIAKQSQGGIIQMLSVKSTKVEVYETKPLFTLLGIPFFVKERLLKTYFFGEATPVNLGSYALLEGMSEPFIIYRPGFRGYVSPEFLPYPKDWYSHRIFDTKLTRIQNVSFVDLENPENSFFVEKSGPRSFTVFDHHKKMISNYDTLLLITMLSEFRNLNYETYLKSIRPSLKDSIVETNGFRIISLTDVDNKTTTLRFFHRITIGELYEDGDLINDVYHEYSQDNAYAIINENPDEIYTVQFFQFERQIQPLSYFLKHD